MTRRYVPLGHSGTVERMMVDLPEINKGPKPSNDDLAPYLKSDGATQLDRLRAELEWSASLRNRDPDAFLMPFATEAFPALGFQTYQDYLASPLWRRIKAEELLKAGRRCAACKSETGIVHHRDYRPRVLLGDDRSALVVLCEPCHTEVHRAETGADHCWNDREENLRRLIERCAPDI
jgi:hypothetical protein